MSRRYPGGPVALDLTFLDFVDCAGARALAAVVESLKPRRLAEVSGFQPTVARLLELTGIDLSVSCRPRAVGALVDGAVVVPS